MGQSWGTSPASVLRWGLSLLGDSSPKAEDFHFLEAEGLGRYSPPPASRAPQPAGAVEFQDLPAAGKVQNESLNPPPFLLGLERPSDQQR